jgi:nucleoside-diphosphate-sugar epimerase
MPAPSLPAFDLPCDPGTADLFLGTPSSALLESPPDLPDRVVVLGAGGKMGLHLCLMLQQLGVREVVAVSRFASHRDRGDFERHRLRVVPCDLSVEAELAKLPEAKLVFFLAGVKFGTATAPDLLYRGNVLVPRLVARRYRGSRVVALSTGCVYPFVPVISSGATESTPPHPMGDYAQSCLQREQEFGHASASGDTPVALIRLNYAVEFRYGVLVDVAQKVLRREPIALTMGHVNLIWQRDAIEAVIRARDMASCPALAINVTGPAIHRVRDLAIDFGRLFGEEPRFVGQEAETAWLNDASWSHHLWGPPATDLATMQRWIAGWLHAGFPTWGKPTGFEKRDGKF